MAIINLCFLTPEQSVGGQKQTEELKVLELVPRKNLDFQKMISLRQGGCEQVDKMFECPFIDCSILKNNSSWFDQCCCLLFPLKMLDMTFKQCLQFCGTCFSCENTTAVL